MAERTFEGRGDKLADARMSWLSGRVADDARLGLLHFRMLAHLGRQNHRRGWLRLSQQELAEAWGCSRSRLNQAIGDLVDWGYVRKRTQAESHESYCTYKVRLDDPEDDDEQAGNMPEGECSPGGTPHQGGSVPPAEHLCSPGGTPLFPGRNTPHHITARAPTTPIFAEQIPAHTSSRSVCASGGNLVDELRAEGQHLHVIEHLIAPLWGKLRFDSRDEPGQLLRGIRDVLAELPDGALIETAQTLLRERTVWPSAAVAWKAAEACQRRHMVRIERGTTEWVAWAAHWRAAGHKFLITTYEAQGYAMVPRRFPPVAAAKPAIPAHGDAE